MVHRRGEIYWADLGDLAGSEAAGKPLRPVVIVQSDRFRYGSTLLVVPLTTSRERLRAPGAISVARDARNELREDSVATPHLLLAVDRTRLRDRIGSLQARTVEKLAESACSLVEG